jgi:RND family efflux transporter MFP subunit
LVEQVLFVPGKRVRKGDILLTLHDEEQAVALARAKAQYPIAKANSQRFHDLLKQDAGSAQEAESAFNAFKTAEADLRAAEVALQRRTIIAPFDGIVGLTTVEVGDYIRIGDTIATLDDTSSIVIEFSVPQEVAGFVELGEQVSVRLASSESLPVSAEITAVDSRVNSVSRTLGVEATMANNGQRIIPGAVFNVKTTRDGVPALMVPGLAIQWDRSGAYVWSVDEQGVAKRSAVVILQRTDEQVLVQSTLLPEQAIVAEGADRVRVGVQLVQDKP